MKKLVKRLRNLLPLQKKVALLYAHITMQRKQCHEKIIYFVS